jgi:alpha-L-rhamnosidase
VSWRFEGNVIDWEQQSYDLEVDRDDYGVPQLYSVESDDSLYIPWPDKLLASAESARVRVKVHVAQG